jgi:hypothetical protein
MLSQQGRVRIKLMAAFVALIAMIATNAHAQSNPYKWDEDYGKTPGGKGYIMLAALGVDSKGNIWGGDAKTTLTLYLKRLACRETAPAKTRPSRRSSNWIKRAIR